MSLGRLYQFLFITLSDLYILLQVMVVQLRGIKRKLLSMDNSGTKRKHSNRASYIQEEEDVDLYSDPNTDGNESALGLPQDGPLNNQTFDGYFNNNNASSNGVHENFNNFTNSVNNDNYDRNSMPPPQGYLRRRVIKSTSIKITQDFNPNNPNHPSPNNDPNNSPYNFSPGTSPNGNVPRPRRSRPADAAGSNFSGQRTVSTEVARLARENNLDSNVLQAIVAQHSRNLLQVCLIL